MIRLTVISIFLLFTLLSFGQAEKSASPSAMNKLKKVREALNNLEWTDAKVLSDKLVKQFPMWTESWKVSAEVYQATGDLVGSENALRKLVAIDSSGFPDAYLWIAQWTFNRGDYAGAGENLNRYLTLIRDTSGLPYPTRLLKSSLRYALKQISSPDSKLPVKLGYLVNTSEDEYFPSLAIDGSSLVFTRQTTTSVAGTNEKRSQEDLWYSAFRDTGYLEPRAFSFPINTSGNEGTQSLSQDGRIMFLTACSRPDSKGGCDIYYCVRSGESWSDPVNLGPPVNTRYWESTPFLAQDGKRLFFSSNRPGGSGGMDIWVSTLKVDRSWSAPVNLGPPINTPRDEMSAIVLVDGQTAFFASNGHPGMGGLDLFKAELSGIRKFSEPVNLGYPINTHADESGLTINAGLKSGLFASARNGTGKDIYVADMSQYIRLNKTITISGTVTDRLTGMPVGARVEVLPHGDSVISSVDSDPVTGTYLLGITEKAAYRIGAASPGYLPFSGYLRHDSLAGSSKIIYSIMIEPVKSGAVIVLQNIFFAFNSYELLPESDKDLEGIIDLFDQNPGIVLEVSGYTDSVGTDDYNLNLSQKRVESVMKFLIAKGINPGQLKAHGYGSANPISTNETEEGRSLNRRTEIRVLRIK